jgi:hypothetical protein
VRGVRRPIPVLLRGQTRLTHQPAASFDFQVRVGHPETGQPGRPAPCVLILTRSNDRDVDDLSLWFAAKGIPLLRLDSDRAPSQDLCWDVSTGLIAAGEWLFEPRVCWLRYFSPGSIPVAGNKRVADYVRRQWTAFARALAAGSTVVLNSGLGPGEPDRLSQLSAARAAGIRVPATVAATCLRNAAPRLAGGGDIVVKSLAEHYVEPDPGLIGGLFPRRLSRRQLSREAVVEPAPVLLQEFIPASRELRIYAVGNHLVSFEIAKTSLNSVWTDPEGVDVRLISTPRELQPILRKLMRGWSLDVAAFDLLQTDRGPVFLEVNAVCDWLYYERQAGCTAVSDAVKKLISQRFERSA